MSFKRSNLKDDRVENPVWHVLLLEIGLHVSIMGDYMVLLESTKIPIGTFAEDFSLTGTDDNIYSPDDFKGKMPNFVQVSSIKWRDWISCDILL